jgi:hypothetical protein
MARVAISNDPIKLFVIQMQDGKAINYLGRVVRSSTSEFIALPDIVSVERRFLHGDMDAAREALQTHCALYNLPRDRTHVCSLKYWHPAQAGQQCEKITADKSLYWPFDIEEIDPKHNAKRLPFSKIKLSVVPIQLLWGQPHTAELL